MLADKYYDFKIPAETMENSINEIKDKVGYVELSDNIIKFYDTNKNTKKLLYSITLPQTVNIVDNLKSTSSTEALSANQGRELADTIVQKPGTITENHSEIFNDYVTNNTYDSQYSHCEGYRNSIGIPCFEVNDVDTTNKTLTINTVLGLSVGQNIHAIISYNIYTYVGTIVNIQDNTITIDDFKGIPSSYIDRINYIFVVKDKGVKVLVTGDSFIGGDYSHVEGYSSRAGGRWSHAEGNNSQALGNYSHAEGHNTVALGTRAHVEGRGTRADSENQHVEGKYNIIDYEDKYAHIIGNGKSKSQTSNALTVDWDGSLWTKSDIRCFGNSYGDDNSKAVLTEKDIVCKNSRKTIDFEDYAENVPLINYQIYGNSIQNKSIGKNLIPYPYTETTSTKDGISITDNGDGTLTLNGDNTESGVAFTLSSTNIFEKGKKYMLSLRSQNSTIFNTQLIVVLNNSSTNYTCLMNSSKLMDLSSLTEDITEVSILIMMYPNQNYINETICPQIEIGESVTSYETPGDAPSPNLESAIRSVGNKLENGKYDIPIIADIYDNNPITSHIYLEEPLRKIGDYSDYIDFRNKKIIRNIKRIYLKDLSVNNITYYSNEMANLGGSKAAGWDKATTGCVAFNLIDKKSGYNTSLCNYFKNIANNEAINNGLLAKEGYYTDLDGTYVYCYIGENPKTYNSSNPISNWNNFDKAYVEYVLETPIEESLSEIPEINLRDIFLNLSVHTDVPISNMITWNYSKYYEPILLDTLHRIIGKKGTGENSEIFNDYSNNSAIGKNSHAEGSETTAEGDYSHAEGKYSMTKGENSHAEGYSCVAIGDASHAETWNTQAYGVGSHAEGRGSVSYGVGSHAEGNNTYTGTLAYKVLEFDSSKKTITLDTTYFGNHTIEIGDIIYGCSGAESNRLYYSFGKTTNVNVSLKQITVENFNNSMNPQYISINGKPYRGDEPIFGSASHAEGRQTIAVGDYQHVQGQYNIADSEGKYAHIVGNGTGDSDDKRSNAHTLDWNGNAWYQGTVECTGIILISPNGSTYKVTVDDTGELSTEGINVIQYE